MPNVAGLLFKEHEGSYLVGMIAAKTSRTGTVGFVGGMDIPLIRRFEKGYEEGAKAVNPAIQVIQNYVGVTDAAWNNPGKGKELSLAQMDKGADVIFAAAGNSGLGAFDAVEQAGTENGRATHFVIGVDSNQNGVKPGFVLTSMVKRVDNAVYDIVKEVVDGQFKGGFHVFGLESDGVGYVVDQYNRNLVSAGRDCRRRRGEEEDHRRRNQGDGRDGAMKLELRDITKRFGAVLANDHLNITVASGTIHAIVGENGAGKSTAMRIAYGFYTADSGEILVDGEVRDDPRTARCDRARHRHGPPALHAGPADDRDREHRARRRTRISRVARSPEGCREHSRALGGVQARGRSGRAQSRRCRSASSSASSC